MSQSHLTHILWTCEECGSESFSPLTWRDSLLLLLRCGSFVWQSISITSRSVVLFRSCPALLFRPHPPTRSTPCCRVAQWVGEDKHKVMRRSHKRPPTYSLLICDFVSRAPPNAPLFACGINFSTTSPASLAGADKVALGGDSSSPGWSVDAPVDMPVIKWASG